MREIRDLAAGMKETIASLKKMNIAAKSELNSEVERANVNASKVKAFTKELKDANLEVESFLGETGSNFPTSEGSDTPQPSGTLELQADRNGVMINQGVKQ